MTVVQFSISQLERTAGPPIRPVSPVMDALNSCAGPASEAMRLRAVNAMNAEAPVPFRVPVRRRPDKKFK